MTVRMKEAGWREGLDWAVGMQLAKASQLQLLVMLCVLLRGLTHLLLYRSVLFSCVPTHSFVPGGGGGGEAVQRAGEGGGLGGEQPAAIPAH